MMIKPCWVAVPASALCLSTLLDASPAQEAPSAPLANVCLAAEYVYAGSRLLAVAKGPLPTVALSATSSAPSEASGNAPISILLTTLGECPTEGNIVVHYSTGSGTATPGVDYAHVPAGVLTIPAQTASGVAATINVSLTNDALDEDNETFTVNLGSVTGATLSGAPAHTVTIVDDDPEPTLEIADATTLEPEKGVGLASHAVTLRPVSGRTVTVNYATGGGTATPQSGATVGDYQSTSGLLLFPAGVTDRAVSVPINPDDIDEPTETYFVTLTGAVNVNVPLSDLQAQGTIQDGDPTPSVSVSDNVADEGDEGANKIPFLVSLSNPSSVPVTVNYATADGTAGVADYTPTSGQVSFSPGDTFEQPQVNVTPDGVVEPDEYFLFNLTSPQGAVLGDAQAVGVIRNDDPPFVASVELSPGADQTQALIPRGGVPAVHLYRLGQKPRSSYEVVIDATSGDVGGVLGMELQRLHWNQSTVLQESVPVSPEVLRQSRSLRWLNLEFFGVSGQFVRVRSTQCGADCGTDDTYRIRALDTTYAISRFNNSGGQVTLLQIQNSGPRPITVWLDYWDASGAFLAAEDFALDPKASRVINTSVAVGGHSGSITVMHTAAYGDLTGKAVSIEPATGYSFDTPMVPRGR